MKLSLAEAGFSASSYAIVAVSLVVALLTLYSMVRIWSGVFWGDAEVPTPAVASDAARLHAPRLMTAATAGLVLTTLVVACFAGPIYDLAFRAAEGLVDPTAYTQAVLGR